MAQPNGKVHWQCRNYRNSWGGIKKVTTPTHNFSLPSYFLFPLPFLRPGSPLLITPLPIRNEDSIMNGYEENDGVVWG